MGTVLDRQGILRYPYYMGAMQENTVGNIQRLGPNKLSVLICGRLVNAARIARLLNVHYSHISRIASGQRTPSVPLAVKLAEVLGVTVDELLKDLAGKRPAYKGWM